MIWPYVALWVASMVLSYVLMPKPQTSGQSAASFSDLDVPTAEVGKPIPVLFGTRDIAAPNVVWYGDFRTAAIKSKGGKK